MNGNTVVSQASKNITLVSDNLSGVKVYPNPWRLDGKHAVYTAWTFDGLTVGTTIKIFTVSGHEVKELNTDSSKISWDLTNDSGDKVASGIYLYLITDSQGDKVRGKVGIIWLKKDTLYSALFRGGVREKIELNRRQFGVSDLPGAGRRGRRTRRHRPHGHGFYGRSTGWRAL